MAYFGEICSNSYFKLGEKTCSRLCIYPTFCGDKKWKSNFVSKLHRTQGICYLRSSFFEISCKLEILKE